MTAYTRLVELYQKGIQAEANASRLNLENITDMRVLYDLHEQSRKDHIHAGKTENAKLWNDPQDRGRAISNQMVKVIEIYGSKFYKVQLGLKKATQ